jgi:hypothetical protein
MMEPFWISGVLIRVRDGKRIEKLEELGGSAEVLEQWQSVASTDQDGLVNISVNLRGVDYIVDRERLVALSEEASKDNGL